MARVAYGHPEADRSHFLDWWLEQSGYGLLAISYPSDHPLFYRMFPGMNIREWGVQTAEAIHRYLGDKGPHRKVILAAWSMGGRSLQAVASAAQKLKIDIEFFVSLAASPPLLGLTPSANSEIQITKDGLHDAMGFDRATGRPPMQHKWTTSISEQERINDGDQIIDDDIYWSEYRCNHPLQFSGSPFRYVDGRVVYDADAASDDLGERRFETLPLIGSIVPTSPLDARHVLTDKATWAFINTHVILQKFFPKLSGNRQQINESDWRSIGNIFRSSEEKLHQVVSGNHLFFMGRLGAKMSVNGIVEIGRQIADLKAEIASVSTNLT